MKKVIIILIVLLVSSLSVNAIIIQKNITQARLGRIVIDRVIKTDMDTGEVNQSLLIRLYGSYFDEDGNPAKKGDLTKEYEWNDIPQEWRDEIVPIFKKLSKVFNNEFANENTETF